MKIKIKRKNAVFKKNEIIILKNCVLLNNFLLANYIQLCVKKNLINYIIYNLN